MEPLICQMLGSSFPPSCLFENNDITNESIITQRDLEPFNVDNIDELMRTLLPRFIFRPYTLNMIFNTLKKISEVYQHKANECNAWLDTFPNSFTESNTLIRLIKQVLNLIASHIKTDGNNINLLTFERLIPAITKNKYIDFDSLLRI